MTAITSNSKIILIGTSGSGKSTLAFLLSQKYDLKDIELDALHWDANWSSPTLEEFKLRIENAMKNTSGWVMHGNYGKVRDVTWKDATHIIWLNYSKPVVMYRVLKRSFIRILKNEVLWSGNRESFKKTFLSKDSIILWAWNTYDRRKLDYEKTLKNYSDKKIIIFNKTSDANNFLKSLDSKRSQ